MAEDLERERFEFAFERIETMKMRKAARDKLAGLPVLMRTQGLLVAYAMLRSDERRELADAIEVWLTRRAPHRPLGRGESEGDANFMVRCARVSRSAFLAAQWEAVQFARSLKLVGEALEPPERT